MALTYDPDHEESESNCSLVPFDGATHPGLDGPGIKPGSDLEDSQVHSRGSSIIRLPGPKDSQDREYIIEQVKDAAMIVGLSKASESMGTASHTRRSSLLSMTFNGRGKACGMAGI